MELKTPLCEKSIRKLKVGDIVYISGKIVTARDRAHERALKRGKFPEDIENGIIFHSGPIVKKIDNKWEIISIGPTTSSRMNKLEVGFIERFKIKGIVGKGGMNNKVKDAMKGKVVYLAMTGGCSAIAAKSVKDVKRVHWLDVGVPEAVWVLEVEKLGPLIVGIDSKGNSLYEFVWNKIRENLGEILKNEG